MRRHTTACLLTLLLAACSTENNEPESDEQQEQESGESSSMGVRHAGSSSSSGAPATSAATSSAAAPMESSSLSASSSRASSSSSRASSSSSVMAEVPALPPCIQWDFTDGIAPFTLDNDLRLADAQDGNGVLLTTMGAGDPFFSTSANVDLDRCKIVEIRFSATSSATDGQIFWVRQDQEGYFNEPESQHFPHASDGVVRMHRIDLSSHPQWTGTLRSIRFDLFDGMGNLRVVSIAIREDASHATCGQCGPNQHCVDGACLCDFGFAMGAAGCIPSGGGDLAQRSTDEVCEIVRQGSQLRPDSTWSASDEQSNACTLGTLTENAKLDAVTRVNMYRMLVGLPGDVQRDESDEQAMQECARIQQSATAFVLSHSPPADTPCYTPSGGGAAGRANLAKGVGHPTQAIDLYIDDSGVPSLGHRRWILNPALDRIAVGHVAGSNCTGVFHSGGSANPDFVAYPAPGPFPLNAFWGMWSIELGSYYPAQDAHVKVTRKTTGEVVADGGTVLGAGYGRGAVIAWDAPKVEGAYEVRVSGLEHNGMTTEIVYETRLVTCN